MKKESFNILIIILIFFSCKIESRSGSNKLIELDSYKTTELIIQILKDEDKNYLSLSCIVEKPLMPLNFYDMNLDNNLEEHLKIKDSTHSKLQFKLLNEFRLTPKIIPDKNILTQKQFKELEIKSKQGDLIFWDWLDKNCENGYCSISKPIFNETFDLAYVQIQQVCGSLCCGGEERIYELINGKWSVKETLGSWVS